MPLFIASLTVTQFQAKVTNICSLYTERFSVECESNYQAITLVLGLVLLRFEIG